MNRAEQLLQGGLCGEYATFAVKKILEKYPQARNLIEYVVFDKSCHQLIVIGRDKKSSPCDPNTWGNDAVICDPWARKVYKVSDLKKVRETSKIAFVEPTYNNEVTAEEQEHSTYLEGEIACYGLANSRIIK